MPIEISSGVLEEMMGGLLLALILGAYKLFCFWLDRRKQRRYINEVVSHNINKIIETEKNSPPPPPGTKITKEQIKTTFQKAFLDRMRKDLLNYLSSARIEISLEDIVKFKKIFEFFDFLESQNTAPTFKLYETELIKPLKEIKWLKLD